MKIIIDMNLSPAWVAYFKTEGWEAKHWTEVGPPNASDKEIMEWAKKHSFIVLTHDLDFTTILAITRAIAPSVVQVRTQNLMPDYLASLIIDSIHRFKSELKNGAIISIDEQKSRIKVLPFD